MIENGGDIVAEAKRMPSEVQRNMAWQTAESILRCHQYRLRNRRSKYSWCANCKHGGYENGPCPSWNENSFLILDGV